MNDKRKSFSKEIDAKIARKLKARSKSSQGVWFGLGMMGIVGWSIVTPTLLGAALGVWLDKNYGGERSWTLALLVGGLVLGCVNAWYWVSKEAADIHEEQDENDDQ